MVIAILLTIGVLAAARYAGPGIQGGRSAL
jgi:hypothetical protein